MPVTPVNEVISTGTGGAGSPTKPTQTGGFEGLISGIMNDGSPSMGAQPAAAKGNDKKSLVTNATMLGLLGVPSQIQTASQPAVQQGPAAESPTQPSVSGPMAGTAVARGDALTSAVKGKDANASMLTPATISTILLDATPQTVTSQTVTPQTITPQTVTSQTVTSQTVIPQTVTPQVANPLSVTPQNAKVSGVPVGRVLNSSGPAQQNSVLQDQLTTLQNGSVAESQPGLPAATAQLNAGVAAANAKAAGGVANTTPGITLNTLSAVPLMNYTPQQVKTQSGQPGVKASKDNSLFKQPDLTEPMAGSIITENQPESDVSIAVEPETAIQQLTAQAADVKGTDSQALGPTKHSSDPFTPTATVAAPIDITGGGPMPLNLPTLNLAPALKGDTSGFISYLNQHLAPAVLDNLSELAYSSTPNMQSFQIKLQPEHLGDMLIKVDLTNGQLTTHFIVDNPQVGQMLSNLTHQLREVLQNQGLSMGHMDVNVQQNPRQNSFGIAAKPGRRFQTDAEEVETVDNRPMGDNRKILDLWA